MQRTVVIDKRSIILCALALILNLIFFSQYHHNDYYLGILTPHGDIAYNVYKYNSIKINPARIAYVDALQRQQKRPVDYAEIDAASFGRPTQFRSIQDTFGYGVVLGLLWKITGSRKYRDIQLLQIFIFCLMMLLVYSMMAIATGSTSVAFVSGLCLLAFLPIFFENVQAMRDVWAFYGVVILLWALTCALHTRITNGALLVAGSCFAVCQWVRPTVFACLALAICLMVGAFFVHRPTARNMFKALFLFLMTNAVIFWLPFVMYNQIAYQRSFVMASGQGLLEGLGEFDRTGAYQLSDAWAADFIAKKYGSAYGTPAFDDHARREFDEAFKRNPAHFYRSMLKRIPQVVLPGLPWSNFANEVDYAAQPTMWAKMRAKLTQNFSSPMRLADFLFRQLFIRLFLLLGYLGIVLGLRRRNWQLWLIYAVISFAPAYTLVQSGIEYRYLTPYYVLFACFVPLALEWLLVRSRA